MSIPKQEPKFPYMQIPLLNPTHLLFIRQENNKGELYNKNWGIHPSGVSSHYNKTKQTIQRAAQILTLHMEINFPI